MATGKGNKPVLGVMVTSRAVHAALLEADGGDVHVLRRFMRQRTGRFVSAQPALPDFQTSSDDEDDYTVQFSDAPGSSAEHMFLGSEFGAMGGESSSPFGIEGEDGKKNQPSTFVLELGDILAECRDAGYERLDVAFSASASEMQQVEVIVLQDGKKAKAVGRNALLELLAQQHDHEFAEETVAFLPMVPSDEGLPRYLAVFPKPLDPVASTLRTMREQQGRSMPTIRLYDTEVPLYLGLARATHNLTPTKKRDDGTPEAEAPHNTLIVRAGAEDTLVLFMRDDVLWQSENLRSLTAYEAPETICSRVLLLQDEYGIGEVQHVLLLSEEREDDLVESFEMFFPDARVESMRRYVPSFGDEERSGVAAGALLPAVAVALRLSGDDRYQGIFEDVNLLPKQLLRRPLHLPVTWHVLAIYVLLFCSVLFFMARYFSMESRISAHERGMQQFKTQVGPVEMDAKALQGKIDSLQSVHQRYMQAIDVLEGLLQGSDKWSRALEKTAQEVAKTTGIWIESWNPRGNALELAGNATARDNVVALAERLDASIASLTFSEIREWPVYSFTLNMQLENDLPEAARYLREQVAEDQATADDVPVTSAALQEQP